MNSNSNLKKIIQQSEPPQQIQIIQKSVPSISLFNNIQKLPKITDKLKKISLSNDMDEFITSVTQILNIYDREELYLSYSLVCFLIQEIEYFVLEPSSGPYKRELLTKLLLPYFDENLQYVNQMIDIAFVVDLHQIKGISRYCRKSARYIIKRLFKKKSKN